ncbi:MAG: tRNA (N6-isopentenyl adenosine(37)-C2)-methylthiotransferase MiaB [Planctomycetes bacterium]|nr:tRNA (N6-isopentenyl adenosine(37)-C2)-methylthiotransferase MiaB [Planctomycetota bacterium]
MTAIRKIWIETYGCQMNVLDSELIAGRMKRDGYELTTDREAADVLLFNTCSVRKHAEERAISNAGTLKYLRRRRPDAIVGIVGCAAQNLKEEIFERLPHVQLVVGPRKVGAIPRLIEEIRATGQRRVALEDFDDEFIDGAETLARRESPFKAYIKAIEGCDLSCAFCIVPATRGRETSRPPDVIADEVRRAAAEGVVEVTLLGQTIDSYGKGLKPAIDLGGLLRRLHGVEGIRRIRFITSHPSFMREPIIDALRDLPKVCKYVHMPAQSGSDAVLRRMRRGYTADRYLRLVDRLRERVPGVEIASDFIVGFPGETVEDFERTLALAERVRFQNAYVFQYSPRPGTDAAAMADDVPAEEKGRRNQVLLDLQERVSGEKNSKRVGQRIEILVEGPSKTNPRRQAGRSDTNQIVHFEAACDVRGRFVTVDITSSTPLALYGTWVGS